MSLHGVASLRVAGLRLTALNDHHVLHGCLCGLVFFFVEGEENPVEINREEEKDHEWDDLSGLEDCRHKNNIEEQVECICDYSHDEVNELILRREVGAGRDHASDKSDQRRDRDDPYK